jgi:hypothetical protein
VGRLRFGKPIHWARKERRRGGRNGEFLDPEKSVILIFTADLSIDVSIFVLEDRFQNSSTNLNLSSYYESLPLLYKINTFNFSTTDALLSLRRTILPKPWESIRSARLPLRFRTLRSHLYNSSSYRVINPDEPVLPKYCEEWVKTCSAILAMTGLRDFVLQIEKVGEGATEDWHWYEIFDALRELNISKWNVELAGFGRELQTLRNWVATNEIECCVLEKSIAVEEEKE